jgi:3-hydroxybutyrate dehydrogenase
MESDIMDHVSGNLAQIDLSGRRALVTGGASGIGLACARRLSLAGASVTIADRDVQQLEAAVKEIGATSWVVDLENTSALASLELDFDILINNAGFQYVAAIEDFPPQMFSAMLHVMLETPFLLVRAVLPHMYRCKFGRIVNVSSVHGLRASPFKSAYVAAKHGLEGLSKVVALEGASRGVTSNTVCPGYVRTQLVSQQIAAQALIHGISRESVVEQVMLKESAVKRLVEPQEVAEFVAFLCGPATSFCTGSSFVIDGGWSAK